MHLKKGIFTQFQKMVLFTMLRLTVSEIRVSSQRILLNFCWMSIFLDNLIAKISWSVAQTPINRIIFWKSVMRTFRCIYAYIYIYICLCVCVCVCVCVCIWVCVQVCMCHICYICYLNIWPLIQSIF